MPAPVHDFWKKPPARWMDAIHSIEWQVRGAHARAVVSAVCKTLDAGRGISSEDWKLITVGDDGHIHTPDPWGSGSTNETEITKTLNELLHELLKDEEFNTSYGPRDWAKYFSSKQQIRSLFIPPVTVLAATNITLPEAPPELPHLPPTLSPAPPPPASKIIRLKSRADLLSKSTPAPEQPAAPSAEPPPFLVEPQPPATEPEPTPEPPGPKRDLMMRPILIVFSWPAILTLLILLAASLIAFSPSLRDSIARQFASRPQPAVAPNPASITQPAPAIDPHPQPLPPGAVPAPDPNLPDEVLRVSWQPGSANDARLFLSRGQRQITIDLQAVEHPAYRPSEATNTLSIPRVHLATTKVSEGLLHFILDGGGGSEKPMLGLTWHQAQDLCLALNQAIPPPATFTIRLPWQWEWEVAARQDSAAFADFFTGKGEWMADAWPNDGSRRFPALRVTDDLGTGKRVVRGGDAPRHYVIHTSFNRDALIPLENGGFRLCVEPLPTPQ